jgi:hypothetical protein
MGQLGFFDADKRLAALSAKGNPLDAIDQLVPWETFRADIEAVVLTPEEMRKSSAGRKPLDAIVMFRMLVLQALNNPRTTTEAKFAPASSTCSQLNRPRWAAGSYARSASCERAPKLACRTWPTTFAAL